jgi:toluene monooxygenase system protein E
MNSRELRAQRAQRSPRRTYACLEGRQRKPSDYEVTTTALLYYPARGFEVDTPVWRHYQAQQAGRLRCSNWDAFEDPARTTYSSYVAARREHEALLDHLFHAAKSSAPSTKRPLKEWVSALRFPLHGLQMASAYVGALAPSGRLSVVAALQAADELRRIQRLCQWLAHGADSLPALDGAGRELWQNHASFQPLRRVVERLLVTYVWEEALLALNGVLKPTLERLLNERLAAVAARSGDELLAQCLRSFAVDTAWQASCFEQLKGMLREADPANLEVVTEVEQRWHAPVVEACEHLLPLLDASEGGAVGHAV